MRQYRLTIVSVGQKKKILGAMVHAHVLPTFVHCFDKNADIPRGRTFVINDKLALLALLRSFVLEGCAHDLVIESGSYRSKWGTVAYCRTTNLGFAGNNAFIAFDAVIILTTGNHDVLEKRRLQRHRCRERSTSRV